jgi:predicted AAA+ superfamily ATPase
MTATIPSRADIIQALSRWNRWGEARLDSGRLREIMTRLGSFLDTPEVVALIGPRRSGKTTVLFQVIDALEASGAAREAMLHVNLEEPGFGAHLVPELLERIYETWRAEVFPDGRAWIFLDEIQRVPGWERWVRARNETEDVKIFVTGSSSELMSSELATLLTGRHMTFRVMPLSFREVLSYRGVAPPTGSSLAGDPPRIRNAVVDYLRWGGFPEVVFTSDEERKKYLLQQYFDDILFKDVALRHRVRDLPLLRNLATFLLGQTASLVSFQRLAQIFEISKAAAQAYCGYLEEAFLVSFVTFYTLKTAERLRRPRKVHAIDTGLRNAVTLSATPDRGRLMETAVYNMLMRGRHDGLFYWKGEGEIDLAERRGLGLRRLIQVTDEGLLDPTARRRELRPLKEAAQAFPHAEPLVVAGALPTPGTGELGVRMVSLGRFLAAGADDKMPEKGFAPDVDLPVPAAEKVLSHLREHGRITRREVSELCALTPPRATRLLGGLVAENKITRRGAGRGTWYTLELSTEEGAPY